MNHLQAAVIGLGKIGMLYDLEKNRLHPSAHVMAYSENPVFDLIFAVDPDTSRQDLLQSISPSTRYFKTLDSIECDNAIDIVSICTPPHFHLKNIKEVMSVFHPKLIFCEKPLVSNNGEIIELRKLMRAYQDCVLVPNISRRWSYGLRKITRCIDDNKYGRLEKIHVRYTRGIYNTGAHLFDLLHMWTGKRIESVQALKKVYTSSEKEGENSYSFFFEQEDGTHGYAEAMNDEQYYLFEIDLFFQAGKISMRESGDRISYYKIMPHHAFDGYQELMMEKEDTGVMKDSCLANAIDNLADVISGKEKPFCTMEDAIYPIYVAEALEMSYKEKRKAMVIYNE